MARTKFQLTGPAVDRVGTRPAAFQGLSEVYVDSHWVRADGTLISDSDRETMVRTAATGGLSAFVLTSSLTPIPEPLSSGDRAVFRSKHGTTERDGQTVTLLEAPGESRTSVRWPDGSRTRALTDCLTRVTATSPPPTASAAAFPTGRLVLVDEAPRTSLDGWVDPIFAGVVGRVRGLSTDNVRVEVLDGSDYNVIAPKHLTLLPEGVELTETAARSELAFEDAIRKAAAHRDAVEGKSATDALIELAKLLVEVAK